MIDENEWGMKRMKILHFPYMHRSFTAIYNVEYLGEDKRKGLLFFSWGCRLEKRYEHLPITVCKWLPNHIPATDTEGETESEREGEQEEERGGMEGNKQQQPQSWKSNATIHGTLSMA